MNPRMKFDDEGIDHLMVLEGYTPVAKHLPGDRPEVITGGYGDTNVKLGETHTQPEWKARLQRRVVPDENYINASVIVPLNQKMFNALGFLIYNIGPGNPKSNPPIEGFLTSTLRRKLNLGDYDGAADEFKRWNKADGQVSAGLIHRRAFEEKLFREGLAELRASGADRRLKAA